MNPTQKSRGDILAERIEQRINQLLPYNHPVAEALLADVAEYHSPEWTLGRSVNGFTLADGQEWHRTDGWTEEMLPAGYRPLMKGESAEHGDEYQHYTETGVWYDDTFSGVKDDWTSYHYRTKRPLPTVETPWQLTSEIKGFRPLADGEEWHRNDWTQDMLPDGWRPLLKGERRENDDEVYGLYNYGPWTSFKNMTTPVDSKARLGSNFTRTRRPLPVLTPAQIADGWVEWRGGECPVWGGSNPEVMFRSGVISELNFAARSRSWKNEGANDDIIAYRPDPYEALKKAHSEGKVIQYRRSAMEPWRDCSGVPLYSEPVQYRVKPNPVMVPLGPDDVKCGDEIRAIGYTLRRGIVFVDEPKVGTFNGSYSYEDLKSSYEINRHDGQGFVRCQKEAK
jgi:hypothetical protein